MNKRELQGSKSNCQESLKKTDLLLQILLGEPLHRGRALVEEPQGADQVPYGRLVGGHRGLGRGAEGEEVPDHLADLEARVWHSRAVNGWWSEADRWQSGGGL